MYYAGTGGAGVFKSTDDGNSWNNIGLSDKSVQSLASNNDYLYAGLNNDGGFYTYNISWRLASARNVCDKCMGSNYR